MIWRFIATCLEKFNFQRIHIQLCKHPSILPVNVLLGSSQVLKQMIFYAPPPPQAMQRWDLLRNITSSSSLRACHIWQWSHPFILVIIQLFVSCIKVCLFGMLIWNEKIVYFYWYLASNKNNTTVTCTCPLWVLDILYRSISTLAILGS